MDVSLVGHLPVDQYSLPRDLGPLVETETNTGASQCYKCTKVDWILTYLLTQKLLVKSNCIGDIELTNHSTRQLLRR